MDETTNSARVEFENLTIIDNEDDDVDLISIPSIARRHRCFHQYCLELFIGFVIFSMTLIIIISGFFLTRDSSKLVSIFKGCDQPSKTGKSCVTERMQTKALLNISMYGSSTHEYNSSYSVVYTALSNKTVMTFFSAPNQRCSIGKISVRDILTKQELIEDGDFSTGSFDAFCLCESNFHQSHLKNTSKYGNLTVFQMDSSFSSPTMFSQSIETVKGRQYNVSFSLEFEYVWIQNRIIIYMSSASKLTVFSFLFVIIYLL